MTMPILPITSKRPSILSRRHVVSGLAALAVTACRGDAGASPSGALEKLRPVRRLSQFGIDQFSNRDQWARFKQTFEAAHHDGFNLLGHPEAQYHHDGPLLLNGVSFDGQDCAFVALSNGHQALRCVGSNFRIANLRLLGAAQSRSSDDWENGFWVGGDLDGYSASDFVIENVSVDRAAPGRGVAAAGFMFNDAHRGRILRPTVRHSFADGIHVTNGCSDLLFHQPVSEATGDDGFAVVSYVKHKRICRNIRTVEGASRDSAARGFAIVGGLDVIYERPLIERSSAAGVYLFSEETYNTLGVSRCSVISPVVRGCVTGRKLPPGFNQGAITIGGRIGEDLVDGARIARAAVDCEIRNAVVEGVGPACRAAIITEQFAVRPHIIGAKLNNIVSSNASLHANGIDIGGRDVTIENAHMTNVAGLPIVVTRTASGRCTVDAPHVDGSRTRGGPVDSAIYADNASGLTELVVRDGVFTRGPKRLSVSLVPDAKLRLINNKIL